MSDNTKIEWCDSTFNPWIGCTKVGPGCDHCYAEADFDLRRHRAKWGPGNPRSRTSPGNWKKPLQWDLQHAEFFAQHGRRRRVFCASLADVFDNEVQAKWRADLFALIADTPNLDWLLLTKRIGNARSMIEQAMADLNDSDPERLWILGSDPWPNVWLGATVCNQVEADRDIPKLLAVPAAVRWLSMEPLLGPVDLRHMNKDRETNEIDALQPWTWEQEIENWRGSSETWEEDFEDWYNGLTVAKAKGPCHNKIDWVVVGGESGTNARPMSPDWARGLRDQCAAAGGPMLFKQWGEWLPMLGQAEGVQVGKKTETPDGWVMGWAGKKHAGRLLDSKLHDGYPACEHFKEKAK